MKGFNAQRVWQFLTVVLCTVSIGAAADTPAGIHVSGRGTLEVEPDMGYVQLQVRREGMDAGSLKRELDKVVGEVLALTKKLGIAERDVTATAVSINPRYQRRDDEMVVSGLTASRSIQVTLRDLNRFGDLLNGALDLGINNLDPMRLDTSERAELEDKALSLAMEDATREATRVAAGFGVALGPVSDVAVEQHSARPKEMAVRAAAYMDAPMSDFSPGVISIERFVMATFSIIPAQ
ncbi:MAG: SIMPL domain-containing protein [Pseudomonadales bacterium]